MRYLVEPTRVYLPSTYTKSKWLETYFAPSSDTFFVEPDYEFPEGVTTSDWQHFLLELGASQLPRRRNLSSIDEELEGLQAALTVITATPHSWPNPSELSEALWHLLIALATQSGSTFFLQGDGSIATHGIIARQSAAFCKVLKTTEWLSDETGTFRTSAALFAPTYENKSLLGGGVAYLHPHFDVRGATEGTPARIVCDALGIHLAPTTDNVLNRLRQLSGTSIDKAQVEQLYRFLHRQRISGRSDLFAAEPLLYTQGMASQQPQWWRSGDVFWANESAVFGADRGYLAPYYDTGLEAFFIGLNVSSQATFLDYLSAIRDLAGVGILDTVMQKRLHRLYLRIRGCLETNPDDFRNAEWLQFQDGAFWVGQIGEERGLYVRSMLVRNDHPYIAGLFRDRLPFWCDEKLEGFAREVLEVQPCSEATLTFRPQGDYANLEDLDANLVARFAASADYIRQFLQSPTWQAERREAASLGGLNDLTLRVTERAVVLYHLKGLVVEEPEPRSSYFDESTGCLWLTLNAETEEYADLIGDALQQHFGIKELREFTTQLLKEEDMQKILRRWVKRGLTLVSAPIDIDESNDNEERTDGISDETFTDSYADNGLSSKEPGRLHNGEIVRNVADELQEEMYGDEGADNLVGDGDSINDETVEKSTSKNSGDGKKRHSEIKEFSSYKTETGHGVDRSSDEQTNPSSNPILPTGEKREPTDRPRRIPVNPTTGKDRATITPLSKRMVASARPSSTTGSNFYGGTGEGPTHRALKYKIMENPELLGEGLKLARPEFVFPSGDRVDILLEDRFGNPVPVEIEPIIDPGNETGMWQALKYQHLAAVWWELKCSEVVAFLVAPSIPVGIQLRCARLGITSVELGVTEDELAAEAEQQSVDSSAIS